jgi:DNA polymerase-3 subunit epsilon
MDSKIFWFDTETTGVDPFRSCVITLAGLIEINGNVMEEVDLKFAPHEGAYIADKAIQAHGITVEEMNKFPSALKSLSLLKATLSEFVSKFDKNDKFIAAGYNVKFDMDFLRQMFIRHNDKFFGSYFFWPVIDVQFIVARQIALIDLRLPDYKLSTLCKHYEIPIDAHDAMSDIKATKALYDLLY